VYFFTYIHVKQNGDRIKISVVAVTVGKPEIDIVSTTKRCEVQGMKEKNE